MALFEDTMDSLAPRQPEVEGAGLEPSRVEPPATPQAPGAPIGRPSAPPMQGGRPQVVQNQVGASKKNPVAIAQQQESEYDQRPTIMLSKIPGREELDSFPQGARIETPYGPVDENGDVAFSPEGKIKMKEALVNQRKGFGPHPFEKNFGAPEIEMELGKPFFNPFTGKWGGE